jgi:hypothetical protein
MKKILIFSLPLLFVFILASIMHASSEYFTLADAIAQADLVIIGEKVADSPHNLKNSDIPIWIKIKPTKILKGVINQECIKCAGVAPISEKNPERNIVYNNQYLILLYKAIPSKIYHPDYDYYPDVCIPGPNGEEFSLCMRTFFLIKNNTINVGKKIISIKELTKALKNPLIFIMRGQYSCLDTKLFDWSNHPKYKK